MSGGYQPKGIPLNSPRVIHLIWDHQVPGVIT